MSDDLYEIAFSGQIADGVDPDTVRRRIGKIFNADEKRLQHMFSGRRVLIKRRVDAATMAKYRSAFNKAGAICEIRRLSAAEKETGTVPGPAVKEAAPTRDEAPQAVANQSRYEGSEHVPEALLTDPLGVTGDDIEELRADVAPVGSQMQHRMREVPEAQFDLSGLEMAPVGSDLTTRTKEEVPPLPDTNGISLAD
jgi:hypothetical protein